MKLIGYCNRTIEYSFYLMFFLTPLVISGKTSELFEFNKMWLTFGFTIVIFSAWIIKMITRRKIKILKTPLDIPILIFLASQIISTIVSLDSHISFWGYYSRFNGGLLSTISYVILYYAFVSNLATLAIFKRLIKTVLFSGAIVALWGLPSHFGYDPTCLIFRGTVDVSCWTADFQPKIRIFSTMGQPDWLAAYVSVLIPITIYFFIDSLKKKAKSIKGIFSEFTLLSWLYLLLIALFYLDLIYTRSRSAILSVWISLIIFGAIFLFIKRKNLKTPVKELLFKFWQGIIIGFVLMLITFFVGQPFAQLDKFTYPGITAKINELKTASKQTKTVDKEKATEEIHYGELGGTDSSKIRLIVWEGALNIWKNNPVFGTGVETFAFAYYRYKIPEHNLTSEWNFLYNKAHNEYLNYLATTGILGLGSYLSIIFIFLWIVFIKLFKKFSIKEIDNNLLFTLSLVIGYFTILISNFFGFSVVIINLFFFLIPAFVFAIQKITSEEKAFTLNLPFRNSKEAVSKYQDSAFKNSTFQTLIIFIVLGISLVMLYKLYFYWEADKAYAYGMNLNRSGQYQDAYPYLHKAVEINPNEPVYKNENAVNDTMLAISILSQKEEEKSTDSAKIAESLIQEAVKQTNEVTINHPNNIVFKKSQTRIFYSLSQVDQRYLPLALEAIKRAQDLAPTDANISYNLAVLYGQNGLIDESINALNRTVELKPDYRDAFYALGVFYHQKATDNASQSAELNQKATEAMRYILTKINPKDTQAQEAIKTWEGK
ncbi:MAG TPA: O-antigen ligase family protein [Patescibacteria group bacterium]|nr:O-antigen ligase family protein [Patescibacteria group bacterium]